MKILIQTGHRHITERFQRRFYHICHKHRRNSGFQHQTQMRLQTGAPLRDSSTRKINNNNVWKISPRNSTSSNREACCYNEQFWDRKYSEGLFRKSLECRSITLADNFFFFFLFAFTLGVQFPLRIWWSSVWHPRVSRITNRPHTFIVNTVQCREMHSHWTAFHFSRGGPCELFDSLALTPNHTSLDLEAYS
jgi:hypothetical protein